MRNFTAGVAAGLLAATLTSAGQRPVPSDVFGRPLIGQNGELIEWDGPRDVPWTPGPAPLPPADPKPSAFDAVLMRDDATIGNFTQDLGTRGIFAVDTDGDGLPEVAVGHSAMWYLVEYEPRVDGYVQRYFFEVSSSGTFGGGALLGVRPGDVDGDGRPEILALIAPGTLEIRDAASGAFEDSMTIAISTFRDFAVEDVDGAAGDEIALLDTNGLRVFQAGNATPLWSNPGLPGFRIAIGNIDLDPAKEIVLGSDSASQVVDCGTRIAEWAYSTGFGTFVDLADVDGDGLEEIAGCHNWGPCQVVDGDTRVEKWAFDNFDSSAVTCRDVNGDGIAEVGIGDGQWGDVHFHDGISSASVGALRNPEHSVAWIDFADTDGDCNGEVVWGAGYSSSGSDRLYFGELGASAFEWENVENDGPMHAFAIGDVNSDGMTDVVRACSESDAGYDGAYVFVTDLHARVDRWVPTAQSNDGWMVTQSMALLQADADPQLEYVMNASSTYDPKVAAFDAVTHARDWTSVLLGDGSVSYVTTGDAEGDGDADVVVGASGFLWVLQHSDGAVLYRSPDFGGSVGDIHVADVDGDGVTEIVFLCSGQGIRIYDGQTHFEEWFLPDTNITAIEVADVVPGGALEILAGSGNGTLACFDGASHASIFSGSTGTRRIHAICAGDVDGDRAPEIVLSQENATSSYSNVKVLAASDRALLWTSPPLVGSAGIAGSLYIADPDDDGQNEIAVSTSYTLRFFEHDGDLPDATPPSFGGLVTAAGMSSGTCCPSVDLGWEPAGDGRTPPMTYAIYRSEDPSFVPGAGSLIAFTDRLSHRDQDVAAATTYHYVVRAADHAGNQESNLVRVSVRTGDSAPAVAPTGFVAADLIACDRSGVQITFTPATPPPGTTYTLQVDGIEQPGAITSPHVHAPPDTSSHLYRIVARTSPCLSIDVTDVESEADVGLPLDAPLIARVTDPDPCLLSGLDVEFTHAGFPGLGRYDVYMDGVLVLNDVTSPAHVAAPDSANHSWTIVAEDLDCSRSRASSAAGASDAAGNLVAPVLTSLVDPDPCAASLLRLQFTHPGFTAPGHYALLRDGSPWISPVVDGQTFPPGDDQPHDYVVVAHYEDCATEANSAPVSGVDVTDCGAPALEVELRAWRDAARPDGATLTWTPAPGTVSRHDVYAGTLPILVYDHVAARPGLSFPGAADPTSGCGVVDGATLTAKIEGLGRAAYILVVAVGSDGTHGPYGARSDGIDRHDPSVDPRPPSAFCP